MQSFPSSSDRNYDVCNASTDRPIIAPWPKSIDSWINHLTTISCLVGGIPTPVVSWSRPGKKELVTINQTHVISRLTVVPEKPSDFGAYTCEAVNILGGQAQSTDLKQLREYMQQKDSSRTNRMITLLALSPLTQPFECLTVLLVEQSGVVDLHVLGWVVFNRH